MKPSVTPPPNSIILCVGQAVLDRVYYVDTIPREFTKVRALHSCESGGGMAANAAVAISRLGGRPLLWSRVGSDAAGSAIRAELEAEGVDVTAVQVFQYGRSSTSCIIVNGLGERLIINDRGSNFPDGVSGLPLSLVSDAGAVLADARWPEAAAAAFARARTHSVPTVLDADVGGGLALHHLLPLTDYAIFSRDGLLEFTGGPAEVALETVARIGVRHAGVTLGRGGYLWRDRDRTFRRQPALQVEAVDTTGAGDAFHGAFALAVAEGMPDAQCALFASAVAAIKCATEGGRAGLPTRENLQNFLANSRARTGQSGHSPGGEP